MAAFVLALADNMQIVGLNNITLNTINIIASGSNWVEQQATRKLDIFHNSVTKHDNGWPHCIGAALSDRGLAMILGTRGSMTYLVSPRLEHADKSLHSPIHEQKENGRVVMQRQRFSL